MKSIFTFIIVLLALTACTVPQTTGASDPTATSIPQAGIPNPASIYCTENGNKNEIRTAADGSQNGVCVFPDGNTCDEWAYFRGECGPASKGTPDPLAAVDATSNGSGGYMPPGNTEVIADWWGVIKSTESGPSYDDYFERQDLGGSIYFGSDSLDPEVVAQIQALCDSGKIVHLYGSLLSNVPDYNGSQVRVDRIEVEG